MRMARYYDKKRKWKHFFKTTSITIILLVLVILLYNMYINVDVNENQEIETKKLSRNSRSGRRRKQKSIRNNRRSIGWSGWYLENKRKWEFHFLK